MAIAVRRTEQKQMGGAAARLRVRQAGGGRAHLQHVMLCAGEPQLAGHKRMIIERLARTTPRFRIGDGQGRFLSRDGSGVVSSPREGWFGSADQAQCALDRFPSAKGMRALPALEHKLSERAGQRVL